MPFNIEIDTSTKVATAGGTLLTFLGNIQTEDIIKTVVLSIIGAVVSFCVSMGLKWLVRKFKI
jgi:hypothetical protein